MPPRRDRPDRFIRSVTLTGIQKRYLPNKHYVYMFKVKWSDGTGHIIYRSYSDFFEFHTELVDLFPLEAGLLRGKDRVIPNFPRRKFFERNELRQFAMQQQVHFEQYCNQLISMKNPITKHPFLLVFFQPKFEDIEPPQCLLKKPERVNKLKKMIQKFSRKKRTARRLTIFDPPPELPQGMIAQQYKALNGFTADLDGQVTFEEGDILKVVEKNSCGWWIAEVPSGQTGWVPGSFLEQLDDVKEYEECINVDGDLFISVQCYTSQNDDELSFEAGVTLMVMQKRMTGWWIARYDGEVGYVPASYLMKYTNEDYLRVCSPIMPLKAKAATTGVITPLPTRKLSTLTPLPERKWSILPLPNLSAQTQKSPRRTSVVEIRNEEDALERARVMAALHPRSLSRNVNNNSTCSSESETRTLIPEIIITSPDHEVDLTETVQGHASSETAETNMADNNADEQTEESKMASADQADSMMAAYFDDGSWQKIITKDTNITQSTPINKLSSKTSPFGTTAGSVETGTTKSEFETLAKEINNNQDGKASMDRKVAKFKLTHDNALAKKVILGLSSASDSDISKTSTVKSERPFGSAGSIFDRLSTMGLAGSLCNLEASVGSAILVDKMMSSSSMKNWSTRACAGSAPTLRIDTKSSPQPKREPFQVLTCKDTKQLETTFDLGLELGWYGASFPTRSPAISLCNHTPFALTTKRLGVLTHPEDTLFNADQANLFPEEDNSVFLPDPTPLKLFSTKRNPRLPGKFIDTPRTAGQVDLDWVIFKDGSVVLRNSGENQPTCRTEVVSSLQTKDAEVQHCPDPLGMDGRSTAPPDQPETGDLALNFANQPAIATLVGALQGLTDALAKGLTGPTRILVKDVSQQCDIVPLGHVTDDDDYDYYDDGDYKDSIVQV